MEHILVHLVQMGEQIVNQLKKEMVPYMDATHWKESDINLLSAFMRSLSQSERIACELERVC